MINKELSEQIRGDFEESEKKVFELPILNHCKIKEKIFESYIKGKIEK